MSLDRTRKGVEGLLSEAVRLEDLSFTLSIHESQVLAYSLQRTLVPELVRRWDTNWSSIMPLPRTLHSACGFIGPWR